MLSFVFFHSGAPFGQVLLRNKILVVLRDNQPHHLVRVNERGVDTGLLHALDHHVFGVFEERIRREQIVRIGVNSASFLLTDIPTRRRCQVCGLP